MVLLFLNYFKFFSLSYFNFYYRMNLKIGFLSYMKRIRFYISRLQNKLFVFKKGIKTIFSLFFRMFNMLQIGHFIELLTVGLGYKVSFYRRRQELGFELNYSHKIFFKKPKSVIFRVFKKRFLIFGINQSDVIYFAKTIRGLRSPNIYKGTGIRYKSEKVVLKVGKTR